MTGTMSKMPTIDLLSYIERANSLRPNTKRGYANAVKQWLEFAGADPAGWTPERCQAFYDDLRTRVSVEVANNMITGGLAFAFGRAHKLHGIPNITEMVDRARNLDDGEAEGKRHALSAEQARKLLAACLGPGLMDLRDHAACLIGLYTGMRRMSLVDIDLDRVRLTPTVTYLNVTIKGGNRYEVPLDPRVWAMLDTYRMQLKSARGGVLGGPLLPALRTRLAPGGDLLDAGGRISEDGLYKALGTRAAAAGLKRFTPHLFRHTFATWCRADRIEDYLIEVVTGHKGNRGLVDRVYTDRHALAADVAARCYEAVTKRLSPPEAAP